MNEDRPVSLLLIAGIGLGILVVLSAIWLGRLRDTTQEPEEPEFAVLAPDAAEALAEESVELEYLYDDAVPVDVVPTAEQLQWLVQAVEAQREFARIIGSTADGPEASRLRVLEVKLARADALVKARESEHLELFARDQLEQGDLAGAVRSLQEALKLQEEINVSMAVEDMHRSERVEALRARIISIEVEPLSTEVDRLEAAGIEMAQSGGAPEAEALLRQAIEVQERINREYPLSDYASRLRIERIESTITSLAVIRLVRERDEIVLEAARRRDAGLHKDAAQLFERATELQRQINVLFPSTPHADPSLVVQFEEARRAALERAGGGAAVAP